MLVFDPGHSYELQVYDGNASQFLGFMKREGPGYPGNVGHYPGTNCQEVLRVLIDRVTYLQHQIPCVENTLILNDLRSALLLFEIRAARRHGRELPLILTAIEEMPTDPKDGHIK